LQLTLHGGVFSISGSEAVVDSLSVLLTEQQYDTTAEHNTVGEPVTVNVTKFYLTQNVTSASKFNGAGCNLKVEGQWGT